MGVFMKLSDGSTRFSKTARVSSAVSIALFAAMFLYLVVASVSDLPDGVLVMRADRLTSSVYCLIGIILLGLPIAVSRIFRLALPDLLVVGYDLFLILSVLLGTGLGFYSLVPHWDDILHSFSGCLAGVFGGALFSLAIEDCESVKPKRLAFGVSAFCFALAVGALWEIYEYTFDLLLHMNMQRFADNNGEMLVGRDALYDTMKDIIVDTLGASVASVISAFVLPGKSFRIPRQNGQN